MGLSIDDAAHRTRIHANMIQGIEEDDFSRFPSVAYAKSFIRNYSDFLQVDISGTLESLNSGVTILLGDHELMEEMSKPAKIRRRFRFERSPRDPKRQVEKPGGAPVFLNVILVFLVVALGVFYFLGYNANTPEEARSEIAKGLNKVNFFSEPASNETSAKADESIPSHPLAMPERTAPQARPDPDPGSEREPAAVAAKPEEEAVPGASGDPGIEKPMVDFNFEERPELASPNTVDRAVVAKLRARESAAMNFETETGGARPSLRGEDLPEALRSPAEPEAALRPEGTTPGEGEEAPDRPDEENPVLRAVPVANFD